MKTYFLLILAAGLLGLSSCSEKDNLLNFKLDTPFTLGFQEQAVWDDNSEVKIQFDRVLGDSRCPIDAECVCSAMPVARIIQIPQLSAILL